MGSTVSRFWPIALLVLLCTPLALIAGLLAWHTLYVGVFAPPEIVEAYGFGSGTMGWRFQSREIYLVTGLIEAALLIAPIGVLGWWLLRKPKPDSG